LSEIRCESSVTIHYKFHKENYFPSRWLKPPILANGTQIKITETKRLIPIIENFLSFYPKKVIRDNLKNIYLISDLKFYGKSFGATNSKNSLYIKSKGKNKGYTNTFLTNVIHSEFSSILLRKYKFNKNAWNNINKKDFKYLGTGVKMLGQKNLYSQNEKLLNNGFITKYAQSSLENDFNQVTSWLITRTKKLKKLCVKYPRIRIKAEIVKSFYKSINKDFKFG